jgi:hypothetical protein
VSRKNERQTGLGVEQLPGMINEAAEESGCALLCKKLQTATKGLWKWSALSLQ